MALLTVAGLLGGRPGGTARVLTGVGSLALVGLVVRVGHTGGELVYRHGAASAYTAAASNDSNQIAPMIAAPARDDQRRAAATPDKQ